MLLYPFRDDSLAANYHLMANYRKSIMATFKFYIPAINLMGAGCLQEAAADIKGYGYRKALIVTDKILNQIGVVAKLTTLLAEHGIESVVFDETKPNPTMTNVESGLAMIKAHGCDCVISLGGGSPHDCAKGIALVATNGGSIQDYEGVDCSARPQLPLIAINTTAGTASEMTRFCIITDEARHVKMAIIDKHVTPLMSVNDPELMLAKPAGLTAATGMDALTHAIEGYITKGHCVISDMFHLEAIKLISQSLRGAVQNTPEGREGMALGQYIAGMGFSNVGLGIVHSMAHGLSALYDTPHGVACAILLPVGLEYNKTVAGERYRAVGKAMGVKGIDEMNDAEAADALHGRYLDFGKVEQAIFG